MVQQCSQNVDMYKKVRIIFVVYGINRKWLRHNLFFGILQYIVLLNWLHCFQFEYNYGLTQLLTVYKICINVLF